MLASCTRGNAFTRPIAVPRRSLKPRAAASARLPTRRRSCSKVTGDDRRDAERVPVRRWGASRVDSVSTRPCRRGSRSGRRRHRPRAESDGAARHGSRAECTMIVSIHSEVTVRAALPAVLSAVARIACRAADRRGVAAVLILPALLRSISAGTVIPYGLERTRYRCLASLARESRRSSEHHLADRAVRRAARALQRRTSC
jgi:hypothetical protein